MSKRTPKEINKAIRADYAAELAHIETQFAEICTPWNIALETADWGTVMKYDDISDELTARRAQINKNLFYL